MVAWYYPIVFVVTFHNIGVYHFTSRDHSIRQTKFQTYILNIQLKRFSYLPMFLNIIESNRDKERQKCV